MKLKELEEAIVLQKKAYGLLFWLKERARTNPALLSEVPGESFSSGDACWEWVQKNRGNFPAELRPEAGQNRAFGFVFSSFFSTSFRVSDVVSWDRIEKTLVAGATAFRDPRHKRHAARRQQHSAVELRRLALAGLAAECGQELTADLFDQALVSSEIASGLTLWTYAGELVRRSQFASQGPAVHCLWLELDVKIRKNLSAESIWQARQRLVDWLAKTRFCAI